MTVTVVEVQVPGPVATVVLPAPNTTTVVEVQVPGIAGPAGPPGPGSTIVASPTPPSAPQVDDLWVDSS